MSAVNRGGHPGSYGPLRPAWYPLFMTTTFAMNYSTERRKALAAAIERALTPAQLTMVRELAQASDPHGLEPRAEQLLQWLRVNMPSSAVKIEEDLYPAD